MITHDTYLVTVATDKGGFSMLSFCIAIEHKYFDDIDFLQELNKKVQDYLAQNEEAQMHSNYSIVSICNITRTKPVKEN